MLSSSSSTPLDEYQSLKSSVQSSSLSSMFETLVPVASIATISVVIGYTLPRGGSQRNGQLQHYSIGLVCLCWWTLSVVLSLNYQFFASPTEWSDGDGRGLAILFLVPIAMTGILYYLLFVVGDLSFFLRKNTRRRQKRQCISDHPQASFLVLDQVPVWAWIALHVYRLDGAFTILYAYRNGINFPKYLGLQTLLLDVLLGATSLPLAGFVYWYSSAASGSNSWFRTCLSLVSSLFATTTATTTRRTTFPSGTTTASSSLTGTSNSFSGSSSSNHSRSTNWDSTMRSILWIWNSLGLYDLASAYLLLICNFFQIGQKIITDPPLSMLGFHPLPLILLFQAPFAMAIHVLFLTYLIDRFTKNSAAFKGGRLAAATTSLLPVHIQHLREQQQ